MPEQAPNTERDKGFDMGRTSHWCTRFNRLCKSARVPCVAVLVAALLTPTSSRTQAVEIFAAGQAVSGIVADLEASLRQVIRDVEGAYSRSAFDTRSHAVALIQQVQLSGEALVGKTFGELEKSQQAVFTNVKLTLNEWNRGNRAALEKADALVSSLNGALATIPLSRTWPRVLRYSPTYVVQTNSDQPFDVVVAGVWLGEGEPTLKFSEKPCERTSKTEDQLRYKCPRTVLGNAKKLQAATGTLTVQYQADSVIEQIKGFLGKRKTRDYEIAVSVVPSILGTYSGVATVANAIEERQTRVANCSYHNGHCQGDYPLTCNMTATSGWMIDLNSIAARPTNRSQNSQFGGVFSATSNGFQLRATVRNRGSCGPRLPGGARAGVDARGMIALEARWTEVRTKEDTQPSTLQPGALSWGNETSLALPERTRGVNLSVLRADGRTEVVTGTDVDGWVAAEFRPELKALVLRAVEPDRAFSK